MESRQTLQITADDVANSFNLFEKLAYGQGKAAAGVVVNAVVRQYVAAGLAECKPTRDFTKAEIAAMRAGRKLEAVKLLRQRLGNQYDENGNVTIRGMSLMDCKRYVETKGGKYLAESGLYNADGMAVRQPADWS